MSTIEDNSKKLSKKKTQESSQLNLQLESETKLKRQPILNLQAARETKIRVFTVEAKKLFRLERPVLEDLTTSLTLRESFNANFEALGFRDQFLNSPALFYVPFLVVCYETDLSRRYVMLSPSIISLFDFSAKIKGAFGLSKIKDLLVPRFKVITALISKVEDQAKQKSMFESQLYDLVKRNNLLDNVEFRENVEKGLSYLKGEGWFSANEQQTLLNRVR